MSKTTNIVAGAGATLAVAAAAVAAVFGDPVPAWCPSGTEPLDVCTVVVHPDVVQCDELEADGGDVFNPGGEAGRVLVGLRNGGAVIGFHTAAWIETDKGPDFTGCETTIWIERRRLDKLSKAGISLDGEAISARPRVVVVGQDPDDLQPVAPVKD